MNRIEFGDCRAIMTDWAHAGIRVQTCVTSPPYFGLRDYGVEGQLGLEQTPDDYVANMVEVFRCVRDILADDGTVWLNLGDSYASTGGKAQGHRDSAGGIGYKGTRGQQRSAAAGGGFTRPHTARNDLKPKDLIGTPWRVAFALQADGWYLRSDIIWHKPNPMPESVTDRPTKAHEYLFLLSKSPKYYYDHEAVKEPAIHAGVTVKSRGKYDSGNGKALKGYETHVVGDRLVKDTRNRRSVWTVTTKPYKGAHFATFPPALIEPCILAGSKPGDVVLDPFMGSGTTAMVALQHGRRYLGCELNPEYATLQAERLELVK